MLARATFLDMSRTGPIWRCLFVASALALATGCADGEGVRRPKDLAPEPDDEPAPPGPGAPRDAAPRSPPADGAPASTGAAGATGSGTDSAPPAEEPPGPLDDGGATRDGATARATDAGPSAPRASDACKWTLCESFESLPDGPYPAGRVWRPGSAASRLVVDGTRAARGSKKALRVTTAAGPSETYLYQSETFAKTGNAFWGRMFVWIDVAPTAFVHWNFVELRGSDNKRATRYGGIGAAGGRNSTYLFNVETHGNGEKALGDNLNVPQKSWLCVEWFFDGDKNEARLFHDGQERTRVHYANNWGAGMSFLPPFRSLHVGWALYQKVDRGYSVWIDDLAIDKQRIGCAD